MIRLFKATYAAPGAGSAFRNFVVRAIVFGCIPALLLSIICWFLALAFAQSGLLPMRMALLITILLTLVSLILVLSFADRAFIQTRMYTVDPTRVGSYWQLSSAIWTIILCIGLLIGALFCLSRATTLEIWHYILIVAELLLVAYQTWRILQRRQYQY
jgi:hypothetical protein